MTEIPQALTVALVLNLLSVLTSLACSYFPGLNTWFAVKDSGNKERFQLGIVTLICILTAVLNYTGVWVLLPVGNEGIITLVIIWGTTLYSNMTAYNYTKNSLPVSVKKVKAVRG